MNVPADAALSYEAAPDARSRERLVRTLIFGALAAVVAWAIAAPPALAAGVQRAVVSEPRFIDIEVDSDLLAYDLCWSDRSDGARQNLAAMAIEQITDPAALHVLRIPQLPSRWTPVDWGSLEDLDGRRIPRADLVRGKATYRADVEAALLDVVERIRAERPGARLGVQGFRIIEDGRDVSYERLFRGEAGGLDFAFWDGDLLDGRSSMSADRRDRYVHIMHPSLRRRGLDQKSPLLFRMGEEWVVASFGGAEDLLDEASEDAWGDEDERDDRSPSDSLVIDDADPAIETTSGSPARTRLRAARTGDSDAQESRSLEQQPRRTRSADLNGDGVVNASDKSMLLSAWGSVGRETDLNADGKSQYDLNADGEIDARDLSILLAQWDAEPSQTPTVDGYFSPQMDTFVAGSSEPIGLMITEGADQVDQVAFRVWSVERGRFEGEFIDAEPPFVYPAEILSGVSEGSGQLQAVASDAGGADLKAFAAVMSFVGGEPETGDATEGLGVGMNLAPVTFYMSQWAFTDVFRGSGPWFAQNTVQVLGGNNYWDTGLIDRFEFDEKGYPLEAPVIVPGAEAPQAAAALMCREIGGRYPGGRYICLYDGTGRIDFGYDAKVVSRRPGRIEVDVTPSGGGILLKIVESQRGDHVRNIRLIMPGFEDSFERQQFHPLFLERLEPFNVIRFMDWQRINNSPLAAWSDRPTLDERSQATDKGVAMEICIDLVNALDADPWLCIPHMADETYIRNMAEMIRDRLEPGRVAYIEYSNEVWNAQFKQYHWVGENAPGDISLFPYKYGWFVERAFGIFDEVFEGQEHRIVRVAAGQHWNPWQLRKVMEYVSGSVDAASVAGYFSLPHQAEDNFDENTTLAEIAALMHQNVEFSLGKLQENMDIAEAHGVSLITYEGGQHLSPWPPGSVVPWYDEYYDLQRHPEMRKAYDRLLSGFAEMGGELFTAYAFCNIWNRWGFWGAIEHQDEPVSQAPKYQALVEAAGETVPQ